MKQINLLWIFGLLLMSLALADQTCYTNIECEFTTIAYNTTTEYFNGTVVNSLYNSEVTLYLDQPMVQRVANGTKIYYTYNYTIAQKGTYTRESLANNRMIPEQVTVKDISETDITGLTMINGLGIGILILVLVIGFIAYLVTNK